LAVPLLAFDLFFELTARRFAHDAAARLQLLLIRLKSLGLVLAFLLLLLLERLDAGGRRLAVSRELRNRLNVHVRDSCALGKRCGWLRRRCGLGRRRRDRLRGRTGRRPGLTLGSLPEGRCRTQDEREQRGENKTVHPADPFEKAQFLKSYQ